MKTLLTGICAAIILFSQLSFCAAQSNQPISLKVNGLIVNNFPDSDIVFRALEKGNIAFWTMYNSKPTWDDVRKLMILPGWGEEIPEDDKDYFQYVDVSMVEFNSANGYKIVIFSIPPSSFETGVAKSILYIKYDDFKKIVNKEYKFEIDF